MNIDYTVGVIAEAVDDHITHTYNEKLHGPRRFFIRDVMLREIITMLIDPDRLDHIISNPKMFRNK